MDNPKKSLPYYHSPFGFTRLWHASLPSLVCGTFLIGLYEIGASNALIAVLFFIFLSIIFFGVPWYMKKPTPFRAGGDFQKEFNIYGINLYLKVPVRMRAYKEYVEFRVFFDSFIVPYNRIEGAPKEVGTYAISVGMTVNVPGIPRKLRIHADKPVREEILAFLKDEMIADR